MISLRTLFSVILCFNTGRNMDKEVEKPKPHTIRKVRFLVLCVIFFGWLVIGGAVFQAIEGPVEDNEREELSKLRTNFLNNVSHCISGMIYYFFTKLCPYVTRVVPKVPLHSMFCHNKSTSELTTLMITKHYI